MLSKVFLFIVNYESIPSIPVQFVVVTFWGLYAVDRELVFPKHLDKIVPMWLNHVMVGVDQYRRF